MVETAENAAWVGQAKKSELVVDGKKWRWEDGVVPAAGAVDAWREAQGKFAVPKAYLDFVRRYGTAKVAGLEFYELDECGTAYGLDEKPSAKSMRGVGIHIFARALPIKGFVNAAFTYSVDLLAKDASAPKFSFTLWSKWLDGGPVRGPVEHEDFDSFMAWWLDVMNQKAAAPAKKTKTAPTKKKAAKKSAPAKRATRSR